MDLAFFLQVAGERISGPANLEQRGLKVSAVKDTYLGSDRYSITLQNTGDQTVHVERAGIILRLDKATTKPQWRVFLDQGLCSWCGVKRLDALEPADYMEPVREQRMTDGAGEVLAFHRSDLQTVLWDAANRKGVLIGFLQQRYGANKIDIIPNSDASDIDRIEAWQEFGIELAPGAAQPLDPLVVAEGENPYTLLENFGTAVMKHQGRTFDAPPIVGMMTWYGYRTAIDERIVLENARIIGELFGGYPQPMQNIMLLDHGWQEDANWGDWRPDTKRFAHGMSWLNQEFSRYGVKLGLWYTPFCVTENAPNHGELTALQVMDNQGTPHTGEVGVWGALPGHKADNWTITFLDGENEIVQAKWRKDFAQMREWGSVYWKLDFFLLQTSDANRSRLGVGDLYAKTWRNFRQTVGDSGHLAPCSCQTNLQIGYNDSVRVASDIGNAGRWPGAMKGFRHGMSTIAALWYKNRKFWVNDPDSIQIGKGCSLGEARVRATAVALSGGHLMLSEDLRDMSSDRLEIVRRLIPPYPHAARPLDMFENPYPEDFPKLWALSLMTGFGPMTVLAVFNLTGKTQTYEIRPEMLGIEPGKDFVAIEWWQYRWLGRFGGQFAIEVPPEDVAVIHAQPVRDVPSLVSVSHHITGGHIVNDVSFDSSSGKLTGVLATKAGIPLNLFGHLPRGWGLSREAAFHTTVSSTGGWQSEVRTTGMHTPFHIDFVRTE